MTAPTKRIRAGIVGVTGIVGSGLLRTLLGHPAVEVTWITSDHAPGKSIGDLSPEFAGLCSLITQKTDPVAGAQQCDVVFCAKKGVESMALAPVFLKAGVAFVDIGGEFRLPSAFTYEQWYKEKHTCPELLSEAVYGLPELFHEPLLSARLVANPGCYATSAILAIFPFHRAGWIDSSTVLIDSWSGLSGAGAQYSAGTRNTFLDVHDSARPYALGTHKHTPEIESALYRATGGKAANVLFIPHLLPIDRGILSTLYLRPAEIRPLGTPEPSTAAGLQLLREQYREAPFVRIVEDASAVEIAHVRGSNRIEISCVYIPGRQCWIVVAALDNLVKGAYGQAIQNMNVLFGLNETTGLLHRAL
ncbi:MAG: N-acetyl-gamma-glutamyl-phosphate reductase [Planctomycetota bacterium]